MNRTYDPFSVAREDQQDPYPGYRSLRDETPVFHVEGTDAWMLSRYEDVSFAFKNADVFLSGAPTGFERGGGNMSLLNRLRVLARLARQGVNPFTSGRGRMLVMENGASHTALRNTVNKGFTPRMIARWEERARDIVAKSMETVRNAPRFDAVEELANPLPTTIIAEMLGVDSERRRDFKEWSDQIIRATTGGAAPDVVNGPFLDVMAQLENYVRPIIRARRAQPEDDLISVLVGRSEDAALTPAEVVNFILLLLIAGNETTTNLIGNTIHALLDHPDVLARVNAEPALIPNLIEEMLRWDSPVQLLFRRASQEVVLHGVRIPAGARVGCMIGAANRDERRFPEPDRLDLDRDTTGHLAFGAGKHFCLGASLARLEALCALEAFLPELPGLARTGPRELMPSIILRGSPHLELVRSSETVVN